MKNFIKILILFCSLNLGTLFSMEEKSLKRKRGYEKDEFVTKKICLTNNNNALWLLLGKKGNLTRNSIAELLKNKKEASELQSPGFEFACKYINETDLTINELDITEEFKSYIKELRSLIYKKLQSKLAKELSGLIVLGEKERSTKQNERMVELITSKIIDLNFIKGKNKRPILFNSIYSANRNENSIKGIIEELLQNGANINYREYHGRSPLMYAILYKEKKVARILIDNGADLNFRDHFGEPALNLAFGRGVTDLVEFLIQRGADLNVRYFNRNGFGPTILMKAIIRGKNDVVKLLLEHNADIYVKNNRGLDAIDLAHKVKNQEAIRFLLEAVRKLEGDPVSEKAKNMRNANNELWQFLGNQRELTYKSVIEILQDEEFNIDEKSLTFMTVSHFLNLTDDEIGALQIPEELKILIKNLKYRIYSKLNAKIIKKLFKLIALDEMRNNKQNAKLAMLITLKALDFNSKNYDDRTPLMECFSKCNYFVIDFLIQNGADLEEKDIQGETALSLACISGQYDLAKLLIEKGADVNTKNKFGKTPLIVACECGNSNITELLIDKGANLDIRDPKGQTPLIIAIEKKLNNIINLLIDGGANLDIQNPIGETALTIAIAEKMISVAVKLIESNANVNIADNTNKTPLMYASEIDLYEVAELLLKKGANIDIQAKCNYSDGPADTALALACSYGCHKVVELLIKNGANLNLQDNDGTTPLMWVAKRMNPKKEESYILPVISRLEINKTDCDCEKSILLLLVEHGADVNIRDESGKMALDYALKIENIDPIVITALKGGSNL